MKNLEVLKKGDKFWCWWMSRNLYFLKAFENRATGAATFVFEDINGARFDLTESQFDKLERRAKK